MLLHPDSVPPDQKPHEDHWVVLAHGGMVYRQDQVISAGD